MVLYLGDRDYEGYIQGRIQTKTRGELQDDWAISKVFLGYAWVLQTPPPPPPGYGPDTGDTFRFIIHSPGVSSAVAPV